MREKIANIISTVGHPFLTIPVFVIFVLFRYNDFQSALKTSAIIIGGIFIPLGIKTYMGTKKGKYTNMDISNQIQRQRWYVTAVVLLLIVTILLFVTEQSRAIRFNVIYSFLLLLTAQLLNFYVKSSMHVAFNVFLFFLIIPINYIFALAFGIFVIFIGWSRLELKRHTVKEVIFGTMIGLFFGIFSYLTVGFDEI